METTCKAEEVEIKAPVQTEKCLTITTTNCEAEVKNEEVEICVYVYEKKEIFLSILYKSNTYYIH